MLSIESEEDERTDSIQKEKNMEREDSGHVFSVAYSGSIFRFYVLAHYQDH